MKTKKLALLLASAGLLSLPAYSEINPQTLPTSGVVTAGNAQIVQNAAAMQVNQSSNKAIIDWQAFNIGRDASVRFNQPTVSSVTLNRVAANTGRSVIDGALSANGQVWLLNPDGVMFSNTARVDAGGLLATTMNLGNADFMGGNYRLVKDGAGSIVNQGGLKAAGGGYVALLAPEVRNEGVISARLGTVALATGDELRLDFAGDRLIEVKVDKATVDGLIDNKNLIEAEGGWVLMSTDAASRLSQGAINNTGIVRATTVQEHEGVIKLLGGVTTVAGTLDASAPNGGNGGFIETSGHTVNIDPSATITTKAAQGQSGSWLIDPNDYTVAATGGNITGATLSGQLANNGTVSIVTATMGTPGGNGDILVNDDVTWSSGNKLVLLAERNININANVQGNGIVTMIAGTQNGTNVVNDNAQITVAAGKTLSSTLATSYFQASNSFCNNTAALCLIGGQFDLQGNVSAVNQLAVIYSYLNRPVALGAADVNQTVANGGKMGLTQAEINNISAKVLFIGNNLIGAGTADITVDSAINFPNVSSVVGLVPSKSLGLNAPLTASNFGLLFGANSTGVTQTATGILTTTNLQIAGGSAGNIVLNTAGNNVTNVVAFYNGTLSLNNGNNALTVSSQTSFLNGSTVNGLSIGGNLTLQTGSNLTTTSTGSIGINGTLIDLQATGNMVFGTGLGSSNSSALVRLNAGGDITGPTTSTPFANTPNNVAIRAGGNVDFSNTSFVVGSLAANLTGTGKFISYRPNGNSTVGTVDGLSGITTNNGNVTINMESGDLTVANSINVGTGRINLLAWKVDNQGITINSGATLTSTLATANTTSPTCIDTYSVCIASGRLNILGNISAINQDVNLSAGLQSGAERNILLGADDVNAASNAGGVMGLTQAELANISSKRLAISNIPNGGTTVNITVSGPVNLTGVNDVVLAAANNISVNAPVTVPGTLAFAAGSTGAITQTASAAITANSLAVIRGASATLNNSTNAVSNLAGNVSGDFSFLGGSGAITISSFSFATGVGAAGIQSTNNGLVKIQSSGDITVANNINVGSGLVFIQSTSENKLLTVESGAAITSAYSGQIAGDSCGNSAAVCIRFDKMDIKGAISAVNQAVLLATASDRTMVLGRQDVDGLSGSVGTLGLDEQELNKLTAKYIALANDFNGSKSIAVEGGITLSGSSDLVLSTNNNININQPLSVNGNLLVLMLTNSGVPNGTLAQSSAGQLTASGLTVKGASVQLASADNAIGKLAADVSGEFSYKNGNSPLVVSSMMWPNMASVSGITAVGVKITTSGDLTVNNNINAGSGVIDIKSTGENKLLTIASGSTVSSTYAGQITAVSSGNCGVNLAVCLTSGRVNISGFVSAVNQVVSFNTGSDRLIQLGLDDVDGLNSTTGALGLTNAELNRVTAKQLAVANSYGGNKSITVADTVNLTGANDLLFFTNSNVTINSPLTVKGNALVQMFTNAGQPNGILSQSATGTITASGLVVKGISVKLASVNNAIGNLAADVSDVYDFKNGSKSLTVNNMTWWDQTTVSGITASNIKIKAAGDLTLNAVLTATSSTDLPYSPGTVTDLCTTPSVCKLPLIDIRTMAAFDNKVGFDAISMPQAGTTPASPKFWTLKANKPSTTKLNGLVPGVVSYDASSYSGDALVSASRVFYAFKDQVVAAPVVVAVETQVVAEVNEPVSQPEPTAQVTIVPDTGLGNGGASVENFPTQTTKTETQKTEVAVASVTSIDNAEPAPPPKLIVEASKSVPKSAGVLNRVELEELNQQVRKAREKLFEGALAELDKNPKAADLAECAKDGSELCIAKPLVTTQADGYLPIVKRKVALLIGNNAYRSPIPSLETAVNDVTEIGQTLKNSLGYEVKVVQDAGQQDIVNALNDLIRNTDKDDSVLVMYAGHGYLQEKNNTGYWIPSDAAATNPDKWISNDTIARALSYIPAKQVMLVSDSCYSGTLTKEGKVVDTVATNRDSTLTRRSVLAMSSGADEPVSDEGRDNHSIFAWNMIQMLKQMKAETSGKQMHANLKEAVTKEYPQTPQYGTVLSAGHVDGGEYLFTPATAGDRK